MTKQWAQKSIGEILQLEYGKPLQDIDRNPDGKYPVYGANGEKTRTDKFLCDKPSIIVGRKGSAGELQITTGKFWPLDVTYYAVFNESEYDLKFLYYVLSTLGLPNLARGVKPGINRNDIYALKAMVPPLFEQQRIVRLLDEAFSGITIAKANAEKNLQNTRVLFESYLRAAFTQDVSERDGGEGGQGGAMSEIWKTATLSEFVKEFIVPQRDKPTTFGGDIPWCRIEDFEGPYLSASKSGKCVTTKSVTEMPLRVFPTNTVLVSCSANLGICAITTRPLVTNQTFIGLVPKDDVDSKFLYYLMGSKSALLNEMATGVTIRYLSREKFSNLLVSIPSLPEQQRIVRLLDELVGASDVLASAYVKKLAALDDLQKSSLNQAFRGELEVA
jgi:type I restriction enzyme S subunit